MMPPTFRIVGKPIATHIEERMEVTWFGSRRGTKGLSAYVRIPFEFRFNRIDLLGPFTATFYLLGNGEVLIHCKPVRR